MIKVEFEVINIYKSNYLNLLYLKRIMIAGLVFKTNTSRASRIDERGSVLTEGQGYKVHSAIGFLVLPLASLTISKIQM